MLVSNIMKAALAHCYEEADRDALTRNLTAPLVNLAIAELTDAENAYRMNYPYNPEDPVQLVTEPVVITKPEDDVPYDYHITSILMPLWLAWKVFEGLDAENRAQQYRVLYEQKKAEIVPIVWEQMRDMNGRCCCHHEP